MNSGDEIPDPGGNRKKRLNLFSSDLVNVLAKIAWSSTRKVLLKLRSVQKPAAGSEIIGS